MLSGRGLVPTSAIRALSLFEFPEQAHTSKNNRVNIDAVKLEVRLFLSTGKLAMRQLWLFFDQLGNVLQNGFRGVFARRSQVFRLPRRIKPFLEVSQPVASVNMLGMRKDQGGQL